MTGRPISGEAAGEWSDSLPPEHERSFRIEQRHVAALIEVVAPTCRSLNVNGSMALQTKVTNRKSLHCFTWRTEGLKKERLRIFMRDGRLRATVERKDYAAGVKREGRIEALSGAADIAEWLRQSGRIISAIAKERFSLSYEMHLELKKKTFELSVDKCVPIGLSAGRLGEPFYDFEIEAKTPEVVESVVNEILMGERAGKFLKPLRFSDTKWKVAADLSGSECSTAEWKKADVYGAYAFAMTGLTGVNPCTLVDPEACCSSLLDG